MDITNNFKKVIKKTGRPIAKKIRHIADASVSDHDTILLERHLTLQQEFEDLKAKYHDLENNFSNFQLNLAANLESNLQYIYYYHGGSGNHGCEALVRTITEICNIPREQLGIYSYRPEQDREFGITKYATIIEQSKLNADEVLSSYHPNAIAFSIGGDNYCGYPIPNLAKYNRKFHTANVKTALVGCSIEPDNLQHGEIVGDLCQFDLITARESITYDALIKNGITKNTHLIPDSAFTMAPIPSSIQLPPRTVGINMSSMILNEAGDLIYQNAVQLIDYILEKTKYHIALIPHVHQDFNDDYELLRRLYNHFSQNSRITLIGTTFNAPQIKDIVSQCELLVAARTHCSIAGYSTHVPTLVLGYSVKSRGIAKDIFGTDNNYVKSIFELRNKNEFKESFIWLDQHQAQIRKHLQTFMPEYVKEAHQLQKAISTIQSPTTPIRYTPPVQPTNHRYKKGVLSIITACYNSEKYLHRYLDSILDQTDHHLQLIIVNDGSTDHTEQIIFNYKPALEAKGIELIYLKQTNTGLGGAYDLALKYVSGEFFCWFDSDDIKTPDFAHDIIEFFSNYPDRNVVRFDAYFVPEELGDRPDLLTLHNFKKFSTLSAKPAAEDLFMAAILEKNWFFGNTIALRTSAFDKVTKRTIFRSRAGQNWQLCLPMLHQYKSYFIPKVYNYIIMRQDSVSRANASSQDVDALMKQYDEYQNILTHTLTTLHPDNLNYLLQLISQKYISIKLTLAKDAKHQDYIQKYTDLYKQQVKPNNIYEQELAKLP